MGSASSDRSRCRLLLQATLKTCRLSIAKNFADFRMLAGIAAWVDVHQKPMGSVDCCTLQTQDNDYSQTQHIGDVDGLHSKQWTQSCSWPEVSQQWLPSGSATASGNAFCCTTSITSGQRCDQLTVVIPTGGAPLALLKVNLRVSMARETTASNRANWSPTRMAK